MTIQAGRFAGKVVLVTGAGGGLGTVLARMFAEQGAQVVLTDISAERGTAAASEIASSGGQAEFLELEVTSLESWRAVIAQVERSRGKLNCLINNAGVISRDGVTSVPEAEWHRVMAINLTGPMFGIQAAAPLMRASGGGAVVNISSTAGLIGHPGVAYSASKWGLRGVTKSAALELLPWNIRVNSVHPAQISDTLISGASSPSYVYANQHAMPLKRPSRPDEISQAVLFLASDESSYINASEIVVDGGAVSIGLPQVRNVLEQEHRKNHPA